MTQENVCKSCEYYESCGKPERYMKCMGYKERQQAAGEHAVDVQDGQQPGKTGKTKNGGKANGAGNGKGRVIELLEYYKDIDGEVSIYRKIISDLTDQYYNPIGAIQCDGLPKGKNNISRQTENMALNIPDYVSGEIREYEAKVQQLQALKAQILQEVSRLKLKEKRIIFDFYMHNLKWEQVAVRNSYSERQCKNIRDTALETLSQRFEKNQIISQFQRIA